MHGHDEPVYLISVVAKVLKIHPQTLRQYEREGLVTPSRTDGKMRLYSQRDIDKIQSILRLTRDLGVNLAGVDVILRLKDQLEEKESQIEELTIKISKFTQTSTVEVGKSLVKKKNSYEIIVFGE